jgi:hypothetical protein
MVALHRVVDDELQCQFLVELIDWSVSLFVVGVSHDKVQDVSDRYKYVCFPTWSSP